MGHSTVVASPLKVPVSQLPHVVKHSLSMASAAGGGGAGKPPEPSGEPGRGGGLGGGGGGSEGGGGEIRRGRSCYGRDRRGAEERALGLAADFSSAVEEDQIDQEDRGVGLKRRLKTDFIQELLCWVAYWNLLPQDYLTDFLY